MKPLLFLFGGAICGGLIVSLVWSFKWKRERAMALQREAMVAEQRALWAAEKEQIDQQLRAARSAASVRLPSVAPNAAVTADRAAAETILASLAQQKPLPLPAKALRQVVQQLENLSHVGPEAVPAIRAFLERGTNVEFQSADHPPPGKGPPWKRIQDAAIVPATLRVGLFQTLRDIGGADVEQILSGALRTTARPYEVAALARLLEELAPGHYRELVIARATELLNIADSADDKSAREMLAATVAAYQPKPSPAIAHLIRSDGQVDLDVAKHFEKTVPAEALPMIYQALGDERVTDARQREALVKLAVNFVGTDDTANALLTEVLTAPDVSPKLREQALKVLRDGGLENKDALTDRDRQLLGARLAFLEAARPTITDERLLGEWAKSRDKITELLSGTKTSKPKDKK